MRSSFGETHSTPRVTAGDIRIIRSIDCNLAMVQWSAIVGQSLAIVVCTLFR